VEKQINPCSNSSGINRLCVSQYDSRNYNDTKGFLMFISVHEERDAPLCQATDTAICINNHNSLKYSTLTKSSKCDRSAEFEA
jgi:hypothetical protein